MRTPIEIVFFVRLLLEIERSVRYDVKSRRLLTASARARVWSAQTANCTLDDRRRRAASPRARARKSVT